MAKEVSESTNMLRELMDDFISEFENEYRRQETKTNLSSERRMRKLLRSFTNRVYVPYRDATLPAKDETQF